MLKIVFLIFFERKNFDKGTQEEDINSMDRLQATNQAILDDLDQTKEEEGDPSEFEKKKDLFNIRFKKINNQVSNPAQYNLIKKEIARLFTNMKRFK